MTFPEKLLATNLDQAGRFRHETFDDAERLFDRKAEEPPDAVITDLMMPGINGIEVTRRLRQSDLHLPTMIFAEGPVLERSHLPELGTVDVAALGPASARDREGTFSIPTGLTLAEAEKEYVRQTMAQGGGNVQRAAEILGISRKNLWEKRKKYGLLDSGV